MIPEGQIAIHSREDYPKEVTQSVIFSFDVCGGVMQDALAMKLLGLTDKLQNEADLHCGEGFRSWIAEARKATWGNLEEFQKQYPKFRQSEGREFFVPLAKNGAGITANIFFEMQFLILRCIVPAPVASRITNFAKISTAPTHSMNDY